MPIKNLIDFTVDVKGDLTGSQFTGTFTAKCALSMRETLQEDELYRQVVGVNSGEAGASAKSIASAIAYLSTHVVKAPDWWKALDNGMKCQDINLLAVINNACQQAIGEEYKKLSEEGTAAEAALKALQEKPLT